MKPKKRDPAPLLKAMAAASVDGLSVSGWVDLAQRKPKTLGGQWSAYFRGNAENAIAIGLAFKRLADVEYNGFTLRCKFFPGDNANRWGVSHPGRAEMVAEQEAKAEERREAKQLGEKIAREIVRGVPVAKILEKHAPAPTPEPQPTPRGTFAPLNDSRSTLAGASVIPVEPIARPEIAAPIDRAELPGAWKVHGRPSYRTETHETSITDRSSAVPVHRYRDAPAAFAYAKRFITESN